MYIIWVKSFLKMQCFLCSWILKNYERIDPYHKNAQRETCAHVAASFGHLECLKVIIVYVECRERTKNAERAIAYDQDG